MSEQQRKAMEAAGVPLDQIENAKENIKQYETQAQAIKDYLKKLRDKAELDYRKSLSDIKPEAHLKQLMDKYFAEEALIEAGLLELAKYDSAAVSFLLRQITIQISFRQLEDTVAGSWELKFIGDNVLWGYLKINNYGLPINENNFTVEDIAFVLDHELDHCMTDLKRHGKRSFSLAVIDSRDEYIESEISALKSSRGLALYYKASNEF